MKSDARLLLNKKKWKTASTGRQVETWRNQNFKSRGGVDARKILNNKRQHQKSKNPVLGSYMQTRNATAFIASQIRKEIAPVLREPEKQVQLSKDGNIIITAKSKNTSQVAARKGLLRQMEIDLPSSSRSQQPTRMLYEPSISDMDDLEHSAVEDLLDIDSLPTSYVSSNAFPATNLSRNSHLKQIFENKSTMIADQLRQPPKIVCAKVYVSNLHPSVSQQDVLELFGDVGMIKDAEMLMPGTAIIDFYNSEDAQRGCDIYHNRLLDGLPMKCYLQTPKPQAQRSAISQRLGNRIVAQPSPVTAPSPSLITTNSRSHYNPRNVKFTVKLT